MAPSVFGRVVLPIAEETDADVTCEAVAPFLEPEADVIAVHVIETADGAPDTVPVDARRAQADAILTIVRERLAETGHDVQTELRYGTNVVDEILDAAEEFDATSVCFTPRPGSRWIKLLSGDHAYRLTTETELPVLVVPHPENRTPEIPAAADTSDVVDGTAGYRILVPIDGSEPSRKAVDHACSVYPESDVIALHVLETATAGVYDSMTSAPSTDFDANERRRKQEAARLFDEAREIADEHGVELSTMTLIGNVVNAIVTCTEERDVDLIVMASRGRSTLKQQLLGGITESTIRRSPVPVTVVR